ncbi:helix-turn-helix domain-containing protein [Herbaspirillum sp. alder98]|uniref:HVO_A0114 family putative DNA-binding protein n=1 Tax=Herbaspirillum sp. alder98 TaxID=2913096 RepID=UPI001CD8E6BB|nr:helix-turn-helix domain-containing protein [Herbaspirillum sp. alder98]MCA1322568.1 MarR family transcriptional regulator [Herbaspirillum sp. alder98]
MSKLAIVTGTEEDFFARGKKLARAADRRQKIPEQKIISFEDPSDVARLVTVAKLALFRAVREQPGSITDIAARLHRDRSAVKRDLDDLEKYGLVTIADTVLPGHGRMKEVRATASSFTLQAEFA